MPARKFSVCRTALKFGYRFARNVQPTKDVYGANKAETLPSPPGRKRPIDRSQPRIVGDQIACWDFRSLPLTVGVVHCRSQRCSIDLPMKVE